MSPATLDYLADMLFVIIAIMWICLSIGAMVAIIYIINTLQKINKSLHKIHYTNNSIYELMSIIFDQNNYGNTYH